MLVTVDLPDKLVRDAERLLTERGTNIQDFVRLQFKTLVKHNRLYDLNDRYTFGKYEDERISTVIRGDPHYVAWCLRTVAGFALTPPALDLLSEMGVDL